MLNIFRTHPIRRSIILLLILLLTATTVIGASLPPDPHSLPMWSVMHPYSAAFYAEAHTAVQWHEAAWGVTYPDDFHGQFINIQDGVRSTVGQPASAHSIFLFGNSTVMNTFLPDTDTLPSQLQRLTTAYRVVNEGWDASNTYIEYIRLQHVGLKAGDIAIFYAGIAEGSSAAVTCHNVQLARAYATARGARFVFILQPYLYSKPVLSAWEQSIGYYGEHHADYYAGYGDMAQCADADLSHALDAIRASGTELFIDEYHVGLAGNQVVVAEIYKAVLAAG